MKRAHTRVSHSLVQRRRLLVRTILRGVPRIVWHAKWVLAPVWRFTSPSVYQLRPGSAVGASDAAAALKLANHVWRAGLPMQRLAALGAELGSDIPLFFALPSAKIIGRGERVSPMPLAWRGWVLLVVVSTEVPTPDVFKKWQQEDSLGAGRGHGEAIAKATTADAIMALTVNDWSRPSSGWPRLFSTCLKRCIRLVSARFA